MQLNSYNYRNNSSNIKLNIRNLKNNYTLSQNMIMSYLSNLEELSFFSDSELDLSVYECKKLTDIINISYIDKFFSKPIYIKSIHLGKGLYNLKRISLDNCNQFTLNTGLLSSLEDIILSNIIRSNISFMLYPRLENIILDNCNVGEYFYSTSDKLKNLSLISCNFNHINIQGGSSLKKLIIYDTNFNFLTIEEKLTGIKSISIEKEDDIFPDLNLPIKINHNVRIFLYSTTTYENSLKDFINNNNVKLYYDDERCYNISKVNFVDEI